MSTHQISAPQQVVLGSSRAVRSRIEGQRMAGHHAFAQPDRAEPWRRLHLVASLVLAGLGCLGMIVCWYQGASELTYHDQVPWLVGSIASAGTAVIGGVVWLVCGFRQVSLLERDLLGYLGPWLAAAQPPMTGPAGSSGTGSLVIAPGMSRAHRPECLLVRGKRDLAPISPAEARVRELPTCGVCGS